MLCQTLGHSGLFPAILLASSVSYWLCLEPIAPPDLQQRKTTTLAFLLTHPRIFGRWSPLDILPDYRGLSCLLFSPISKLHKVTDIRMWSCLGGCCQKRKDVLKNAILQLREQDMLQKREAASLKPRSQNRRLWRKNVNSDKNGMVADLGILLLDIYLRVAYGDSDPLIIVLNSRQKRPPTQKGPRKEFEW